MKLSSTWFALILIASALIQSAARSDLPTPSVQSQRCLTHERNNESEYAQSAAQPTASANISEPPESTKPVSGHPTTQQIRDNRSNGEFPFCRTLKVWITGITAQGFFNFVIAFATFLLAIFTGKLVSVTRHLHTATEAGTRVAEENVKASKAMAKAADENVKAAQASVSAAKAQLEFTRTANEQNLFIARESAEAAKQSSEATQQNVAIGKLALKADRPYMVIERCDIQGLPKEGPIVLEKFSETKTITLIAAIFEFKNLGKGPAIIDEVVTHLCVVPELPVPKDFTGCQQVFIGKEAVIPNDGLKTLSPFMDMFAFTKQEECDSVNSGASLLIAYGRVVYRDVFDARYETGFLFRYIPARGESVLTNAGYVWRGPDSHNYRT